MTPSQGACTGVIDQKIDLLVIGAGASGASVAYEATKRGLRVALLEAGDIGCATSCRSSKMLHGGVRYLELAFKTFDLAQLSLVREALMERAHWIEQAPFLAQPFELALPAANCFEKAYYGVGLGLYDALSGQRSIGNSRLLSKTQIHHALPLLRAGVNGGVAYSDGQFNDARLNLLIALTAERAGAILRSNCRVVALEHRADGQLCGAISETSMGEQEHWRASVVVNATGMQADSLRKMADANIAPRMLTSRGVHVVLEANLCPEGIGLLLPATDDGRVLFLLPFYGRTLVGTTDTACKLNEACAPSQAEQHYLIEYVKRWFPDLGQPIVKSCWAGGRPLLKPAGKAINSSRVVREHEVETLPCGLISVMGGKWTTCRPMALDTLKAMETLLGRAMPTTSALPLLGAAQNPALTQTLLLEHQQQLRQLLPETPIQDQQIAHLQASYGLEALALVEKSSAKQLEPLSDVIPICEAEIDRAINQEHARTPTDVLARRCRLAMVDMSEAQRLLPVVQEHLAHADLPKGELDLQH